MRKNFTDKQKAEIYVLDHAVCAFSGKSLWIIDYGISPTYDIDWVDHIKPASSGGGNAIENGVCASYFYNSKKRANSNDNKYMFFRGRPTEDFFYFYEVIPDSIIAHLKQFSNALPSDWYFNRALYRFMCGLDRIHMSNEGEQYSRGEAYYARSCYKILKKWKSMAKGELNFAERGLISENLTQDQRALLSIQECKSEDDILILMQNSFHWYIANVDAMELMSKAVSSENLNELSDYLNEHQDVTERVRSLINENIVKLRNLINE